MMDNQEEIWKDIFDYEGYYQASNLGRIRSLDRTVRNNAGFTNKKGAIKKLQKDRNGYLRCDFSMYNKSKNFQVHQLIAMAFLGHKPCGSKLVINHIDNNPLNNNVINLEIVTNRYNSSCHKTGGTSEYIGVNWDSCNGKWRAAIRHSGKQFQLGSFELEKDAAKFYQKALSEINKGNEVPLKRRKTSSIYTGVSFCTTHKYWIARIYGNKKTIVVGRYKTELAAKKARDKYIFNNSLT